MRKILLFIFLILFAIPVQAKTTIIYESGNQIDAVKIVKAKGSEKKLGLQHPYEFSPDQIREILRSIRFNKKVLLVNDIKEERLLQERHVEFLAPYLQEAFQKAGSNEVIVASYFTQDRHFGIADERLTLFRAYVAPDGLHFQFTKIYAKMLGDRTTKGRVRAMNDAKGIGVALELQPGQERISWEPEELVFDLKSAFAKDPKKRIQKQIQVKTKTEKSTLKEKQIRERLEELDRLKEEELITEKEYRKKRRELLKDL